MQRPQTRRSKRSIQQEKQLNRTTGDSSDSSLSNTITHSSHRNSESILPTSVIPPSSTSLMITDRSAATKENVQENKSAQISHSKFSPAFADTQLLSIYYLNRNITNQTSGDSKTDSCVFVEQQERQPTYSRDAYNSSSSVKPTRALPSIAPRHLSTHGSTFVVDHNQNSFGTNNPAYEQRLRIHSGSQRLANNPLVTNELEESLSPSELVEESRFSYEEYILRVDNNQDQNQQITSLSPISTSPVNTIVAQPSSPPPLLPALPTPSIKLSSKMLHPDEPDSDRTSRLSGDEIHTHSSESSMSGSFTNQDWPSAIIPTIHTNQPPIVNTRQTTSTMNETARVSSWPPVPNLTSIDTQFETSFVLDESEEQRRPSRVQFAEQLIHVKPPSATNSLSEESINSVQISVPNIYAPAVIPRVTTGRTNFNVKDEQNTPADVEDDVTTTTTTTTTSGHQENISGRLQRTSGLTNLHEVLTTRSSLAAPSLPPPPPPPPPPPSHPPSISSSKVSSSVDPRLVGEQLQRLDYQLAVDTRPPINQSKWIKERMDASDVSRNATPTPGRVDALRSLFEQQSARSSDSSTLNSPTGPTKRTDPEERPSRHGDEIRFRVKQPKASIPHQTEHIQPRPRTKESLTNTADVMPLTWEDLVGVQKEYKQKQSKTSSLPFDINELQKIIGRRINFSSDIGYYLADGYTWQWDEAFWLSLTSSQRDQLKNLQQPSRSRQDSGDTQINEYSDRSAYQGDSEDNAPKFDYLNRRIKPRNPTDENLQSFIDNQKSVDGVKNNKPISTDPNSTVSVTGAGAWQQQKQPTKSSGIGKYSESSTITENQSSVSVFGSTPNAPYTRIGSQESLASSTTTNKKLDGQTIVIESGYSSSDEPQQHYRQQQQQLQQQRSSQYRPNSSTIIEEPSITTTTPPTSHYIDPQSGISGLVGGTGSVLVTSNDIQLRDEPIYENFPSDLRQQYDELELDPLSYEQFVYDYLSTYERRLRSVDNTLILLIDGQQIPMANVRLTSNENIALSKNVYVDSIDEYPPPFETESDQLVIFINGEPIVLPSDRWSFYKKKYANAQWIHKLDRVNRHIPTQLMSIIENWLSEHTTFLVDINEMNVDGLNIPLSGRLGSHILDLYRIRHLQTKTNGFWSEILKYLIHTGYISFDAKEQIIHIAESELDVQRLLTPVASPSPELIQRLATLLRSLDSIHFDNNSGTLIINNSFRVPHKYTEEIFRKHQQGQTLNAIEIATLLLRICHYEEDDDGRTLILKFNEQILRLTPQSIIEEEQDEEEQDEEIQDEEEQEQDVTDQSNDIFHQWLSDNIRTSSEGGRIFLMRYHAMPNFVVRVAGQDGIHLSNLLNRQNLQLNDIIEWHQNHARIDQTENSLRMVIKPNNNIEIVDLTSDENEKRRRKVNIEKTTSTNQKTRTMFDEEEEKSLVFFIPLVEDQIKIDDDQEKKEKEHHYQRSISPLNEREEKKKIKTNDNDDGRERALLLESIASLLHFVNANGSSVGTLELIQGRRLRLSLTDNSLVSQQQQQIEFNENDTKILYENLDLDIDACTSYLVDHIFDKIQFDKDKQYILIDYHGQMLKLKSLKQKFLQPTAKKLRLTSKSSTKQSTKTKTSLDESQVNIVTRWLEELNEKGFIKITEQNDIVLLPNGEDNQEQQILINHDDVDAFMEHKINTQEPNGQPEVIGMKDIAQILLLNEYVQYLNGKLTIGTQRIALDGNELLWLKSIVRNARPNAQNRETEVDLFDGENTQALHIPYEHMRPTNDRNVVAHYLFENGSVRYDVDTGNYAYRYVPPDIPLDDDIDDDSNARNGQRQLLSSHIRHVHVDEANERIQLEFLHDPNHRLELPARWYRQTAAHNFDRKYIIDMLLANGATIDHDTLIFNGKKYSLQVPRVSSTVRASPSATNLQTIKLSNKEKQKLIENYVEFIHKQDGIKRDNTNDLLLLENESDGSQLYFTPQHTQYIHKNNYRRQDVIRLLNEHGQIKQDEFGNWLLYYNSQYVQFPSSMIPTTSGKSNTLNSIGQRLTGSTASSTNDDEDARFRASLAQETHAQFMERFYATIDYMYRNDLIVCNRRLKLVEIYFSNQALKIPLDQLRSIINTRRLNSGSDNVLPFESRQLAKWFLQNSDTVRNTREGHIQLTHKNKEYNFPIINPNSRQRRNQSQLSSIFQHFRSKPKGASILSNRDISTPENQKRCANHLLEKLDQHGGINIDNETRRLILSMTPDNEQQLIINNPVIPVTRQTLIDYLVNHGRFALSFNSSDIEYRHEGDGRIFRFNSYIDDWNDIFDETNEQRFARVLGDILSLNGRFLQRADREIIILLRNGERFIIPKEIGAQLIGPVNGQTIAELLVEHADDINEEQDGKYLVIKLADQILRLQQHKQLMTTQSSSSIEREKGPTKNADPRLKLLFPFNKSLRQIQKTPSTSTLNAHPPDASNGYAMDPLLMLANYIYRAGSIYQDDIGRLVIKLNEDEIVVPRIEAINAIETINTSPHRTGTIIARLIDRIGKVQSNKAGGLIITIGRSSFELSKELINRANQLHRETLEIDNNMSLPDQDYIEAGLNGAMTLAGRHNRQLNGPVLLPSLRQSKSVGSLTGSTIGHPWFTDDQALYSKDGRGDARYLNLDNYSLAWQKEPHKHGMDCEVRTINNVAPYLNVLGYVENDPKKAVTISDLARIHPEMLHRGKFNENTYLSKLESDRAQVKTQLCPKPRILVVPDDETMLSSNRQTRFYVQYMYDHDAVLGTDPAYVMMLPSRYPVQPTKPQLIAPHHYRDIALREAPVYVHRKDDGEVRYENLAQYLSTEHHDITPRTVRRMLKFANRDEYREYLRNKMPAADAERLVQESEEPDDKTSSRFVNIETRTGGSRTSLAENDDEDSFDGDLDGQYIENDDRQRINQPRTYYNIPNTPSNIYEERRSPALYENRTTIASQIPPRNTTVQTKSVDRSPSSSSLDSDMLIANTGPTYRTVLDNGVSSNISASRNNQDRLTINPLSSLTDENYGQTTTNDAVGLNAASPEKTVTLPRSVTLTGQSRDGEYENRTVTPRSASVAAKVTTSKSDMMKSMTSSSTTSSREVSPTHRSTSRGDADEKKKEKKSKFRTPSFLRKRKEKKESGNKDIP